MKVNSVWSNRKGNATEAQGWFGFDLIVGQANQAEVSAVHSLRRFNREEPEEEHSAWSMGELAPMPEGGALRETTLSSWLRFYAGLNSRGLVN
ncbi:MAG TPA: hypothetical protein VIY48_09755 [Candidatus Paceibacterota bacterium]